MSRSRRIVIALVAGAFLALAGLAATGRLLAEGERTDPARRAGDQWNLDLVRAPEAWATSRGQGSIVAIVDSGVDTQHPDLRDQMAGSIDCVGASGDPDACGPGGAADRDGHGTHVAGIVAASADDGQGVAGVAPKARLLSVRALVARRCDRRPCGATGSPADVAAGVRWAVDHGADVVNLSVGATGDSLDPALPDAIAEAWAAGVVVVVAGGNGSQRTDLDDAPALVVSAVTAEGEIPRYSKGVGPARWQLAAPGGLERWPYGDGCHDNDAVLSTLPVPGGENAAYGCLVGTSMAAPHVAGAAALLLSTGLDAQATVDRLLRTSVPTDALDPSAPPRLDVAAAVAAP